MSSIDERVVQMRFDNSQFERGIKSSLQSLGELKKGLNFDGQKKGLESLSTAASKFSLAGMGQGISDLGAKFSALSVIGVTALATIANKAISAGAQLIKSLTVSPIKQGLEEYETNLNAIQTILSNTQSKGTNLDDVNKALQELNTYSDQTIYNFSEMAKNIGTFTAAGVDLKTSTAAIKGIANLAAVSGSNSQQASTAMYQLSQALSTGKVSLMDWNSVVNAGMGGQVFQDAIKETARAQGVAVDGIIEKNGSFRDSLQEGWLTSDILTKTLSKFTGDMNAEQLKAQGYTDDQIKSIMKLGQTAKDAATKVKTMSQLIGTLQEAVGSGWSQSFQLLFGDFEEAKVLFTGVNNVLGGMIQQSADARNKVLGDWKAMGGRTVLIEAIGNAFNAVMAAIKPIKEAFREIFPPTTGKNLYDLTVKLRDFTKSLMIGSTTAGQLKRTFAGVFAIFSIGISVIKAVVGVIGDLFGASTKGSGGILAFTAKVGDWLVALDKAIKKGEGFKNFFSGLTAVLLVPIELLRSLPAIIKGIFTGKFPTDVVTGGLDRIAERLKPFGHLGAVASASWRTFLGFAKQIFSFMAPFAREVADAFDGIGKAIGNAVSTGDFSGALDAINTGLLGGIVLLIKKFMTNGLNINFGGSALDKLGGLFDGLTGSLKTMQQDVKANTILKIAAALGILTVSIVALSLIDSAALTKALTAITVMFTQLLIAMKIFDSITKSSGFLKMPVLAAGLILLSTAILILTAAVKNLSGLDWGGLTKGLVGVTVLLGGLAAATRVMSTGSGGLISAGIGMIAVALAIKILVSAVKDFASLDWGSLVKGLVGVGATLAALTIFTRLADLSKVGLSSGAGLILLAVSLKVIASAVKDFAGMDWGTLAKGFSAMAVAMVLIVGALNLIPPTALLGAAAFAVVAASLLILGAALKSMGGMSWEEIGKSLVVLAGSLVIIAVAVTGMILALPGAAALLVVAAALAVLAPVLIALGSMSWEMIAKGLLTLAGALTIIGVAGLLMTPIIPALLGLGVAILLLGVGTLAAGLGLLAFSVGLTALSVAGAAGAAALTAIAAAIIGLIPMALRAVGEGIVLLAGVIANSGPTMFAAMVTLITALLNAILKVAPLIIKTLMSLLQQMLSAVQANLPMFVTKGAAIIVSLLNGIAQNLPKIITAAVSVATAFIRGIGDNLGRIIQSGVDLVVKFINGVSNAIDSNSGVLGAAGGRLAASIVRGMVNGIGAGIGSVVSAARDMASSALNAAKNFLNINSPSKVFRDVVGRAIPEGTALGIDKNAHMVANSATAMGKTAIIAVQSTLSKLSDVVDGEMSNLTPTITPVLDLTNVTQGAKSMADILAAKDAKLSYDKSQVIAGNVQSHLKSVLDQQVQNGTITPEKAATVVTLVQNNSSPKALSAAEIYRNTKNQLSTLKGAL